MLKKIIEESGIDNIKNDEEFMEEENELIREYCINSNFNLSEEDLNEIKNRGLLDALEYWKNEFSC